MKIIKIDIESLQYEVLTSYCDSSACYPLPWGSMTGIFYFHGKVYSSKGGAWGWNLPPEVVYGYGRYCPYVEFLFVGQITISPDKNIPTMGWRIGDRKNISFEGNFYPSYEKYVEERICSLPYTIMCPEDSPRTQGHLQVSRLSSDAPWEETFGVLSSIVRGRRKIYNHQFFGDCRIFWKRDDEWILIVFESVKVVSPDHLDEPLELEEGLYLVSHPHPDEDVD